MEDAATADISRSQLMGVELHLRHHHQGEIITRECAEDMLERFDDDRFDTPATSSKKSSWPRTS